MSAFEDDLDENLLDYEEEGIGDGEDGVYDGFAEGEGDQELQGYEGDDQEQQFHHEAEQHEDADDGDAEMLGPLEGKCCK